MTFVWANKLNAVLACLLVRDFNSQALTRTRCQFFFRFSRGRAKVGRRGPWVSINRKLKVNIGKRWKYVRKLGRKLKLRFMKKRRLFKLGKRLRIRYKRRWTIVPNRRRYRRFRRSKVRQRRRKARRRRRRRRRRRQRRRYRRRRRRRRKRRRRPSCRLRFRYGRKWRRVIRRRGKLVFVYKKRYTRLR